MMNSASGRAWRRRLGVAVVAATSAVAGWALGQGHGGRNQAPIELAGTRMPTVPSVPATRGPDPEILPSVDAGSVASDDAAMVIEPSCQRASDEPEAFVDAGFLERTLVEGTESERHAALTQALRAGIDLPPELLRQTYANDTSEGVRLLAFTTYIDAISEDRTEVRAALQDGSYNGSSAVQAEAQRRLAELERYEHMLAERPLPPLGNL